MVIVILLVFTQLFKNSCNFCVCKFDFLFDFNFHFV